MRIAVIIPTYNERATIGSLIDSLDSVFKEMPHHEFKVVIVDGNSPDGTAQVVREKISQKNFVHLIVETKKEGIASAYIKGINYSIDEFKADAYIEFDGDGQHDPKYIKDLVSAFDEGYDYVIGSRYIEGGSVPKNWAFHRKALSRYGGLFIGFVLEAPVTDPTSGLKLSRLKGLAEKLPRDPKKLITRGYAYKVEFLYRMASLGAKIKEIPIHFLVREHDISKSKLSDVIDFFKVLIRLRLPILHRWKAFKIVLFGFIGLIIQTLIFEFIGIRYQILRPSLAAALGGQLAILSNFTFNNLFTFKGQHTSKWSQRLARFEVVSLGSIAIQWFLVFVAELSTGNVNVIRVAFVLAIVLSFVNNYLGYTRFVWNKKN